MDMTLALWIVVVAALLILEWRRRWPAIRVLLVLMALFQLWFGQPVPYRAVRAVYNLPADQRVTIWSERDSVRVDDYRSGVLTLARAVQGEFEGGRWDRMISLGMLVWLAVSLGLPRRATAPKPDKSVDDAAA